MPKWPIPETDFAGTIEEEGRKVTIFKEDNLIVGFYDQGLTSQAEYMLFSEVRATTTIQGTISWELAAASIEGAHYTYYFLRMVVIPPGSELLLMELEILLGLFFFNL